MGDKHYFNEKLSRRGKADEDLWIARRERELFEARRRQQTIETGEQVDEDEDAKR